MNMSGFLPRAAAKVEGQKLDKCEVDGATKFHFYIFYINLP